MLDYEMKILLVDDSAITRKFLKAMLIKMGFKYIYEANEGTEALKVFEQEREIDLVISDWYMEGMNGLELLRAVRADNEFKNVVFIMASSEKIKDNVDIVFQEGADGYFTKPLKNEELKSELKEILLRRMEKERALSKSKLAPAFDTPEKVKKYIDFKNNYMPIERRVLVPGIVLPISVFQEQDSSVNCILEAEKSVPATEMFSPEAAISKSNNLLIALKDKAQYKNFLKELTSGKISGNVEKAAELRAAVIKENSKIVTKELMDNPRSGEAAKEAKNVVEDMVNSVLDNPSSYYGLMKITSYDYYTYLHSVNVCTLSIGLAVSLGFDKTEISPLALGALMHDVGKSQVPNELINKPGRLTDEEFMIIKNHVNFGLEVLSNNNEIPKKALIPLQQHHEKLNGKGYPNGLEGEEIHLYGRILSIVDVYDALTTERSYKKAFKPFDAVNLLAKGTDEFDQEVFNHFVQMLGKQMQKK